MLDKIPYIRKGHKICIICEGYEEYEYLNRLKTLKVWNYQYEFLLVNAKGNGNIPARYQDKYQNGVAEIVLIFCDTEGKPYEQYEDIKRKINEFHGNTSAAEHIIIFANPCTMQIVLKHWTNEVIKSSNKSKNAKLIEALTGVNNYKGNEVQIQKIMECIDKENYRIMCERLKRLEGPDSILGNSNFYKLIKWLESESTDWIEDVNAKI